MNITQLSLLLALTGLLVPASVAYAQEGTEDVKELGTYTVGDNKADFEFESEPEKPTFTAPDISFGRHDKPKIEFKLPPPGAVRAGGNRAESDNSGESTISVTQQPVPVSLPAPSYPPDAARRHIEGYVVVEFTVTPAGETTDIDVIRSQPRRTFDREARLAVSRWRYQPALRDGQPVPMRVQQTIKFSL